MHQFLIPRSCTADPSLWQSIIEVENCNPCLEIANTTSELAYHWVGLSQILSENDVERSRRICLHENQEHRTVYVLHTSPFSLAVSWWMTVEPTLGK
jgi:hypothetical protein